MLLGDPRYRSTCARSTCTVIGVHVLRQLRDPGLLGCRSGASGPVGC